MSRRTAHNKKTDWLRSFVEPQTLDETIAQTHVPSLDDVVSRFDTSAVARNKQLQSPKRSWEGSTSQYSDKSMTYGQSLR
jgi:hypothetical protein